MNEQRREDRSPMEKTLTLKTRFFLPPHVEELLPGLMLTAGISALALHTGSQLTYVTPLIASMGIGMLLRNTFIIPETYKPGIFFSMRQILRLAVALLGIRITVNNILELGWDGLAIALIPLILTLLFTVIMGKFFKMPQRTYLLLGVGTSICGASAILTAGSLTKARDDDIIVAISSITVFGTISMLSYPFLYKFGILPLTEIQYGQWVGASIHEVAQVVTAAFAGGNKAGEMGILIKLTRVAALIPVAFIISFLVNSGIIKSEGSQTEKAITFPLFLLGFLGMAILNSLNFFTPKAVRWVEFFDMFLFTMAMAGMGLETDFRQLLKIGFRPFFLSLFSTAFIALISLLLILWLSNLS